MTSAAMTGSPAFTPKALRSFSVSGPALSRLGNEHDAERIACAFGPRLDVGIVIALAAQQFFEQISVSARPPVDLRGVRRFISVPFKRRLLAKGREDILDVANRVQAFDRYRIFAVARGFLFRCRLRLRIWSGNRRRLVLRI